MINDHFSCEYCTLPITREPISLIGRKPYHPECARIDGDCQSEIREVTYTKAREIVEFNSRKISS